MSLSKRIADNSGPDSPVQTELQSSIQWLRNKSAEELSATTALEKDVWIYRIVVVTLGLAVLVSVIGAFVLAILQTEQSSEAMVAIGSAAVGAMAGLLAPSPRDK